MADEALIRMANQIAANLVPYGDEAAISKTAEHIKSFWEPRMREGIAKIATESPDKLSATALAAVKVLEG